MTKRMLSIKEAAAYCGLGLNRTREWMDEIGATRHFGSRVLFDVRVIDAALDALAVETIAGDQIIQFRREA